MMAFTFFPRIYEVPLRKNETYFFERNEIFSHKEIEQQEFISSSLEHQPFINYFKG